MSVWSPLSGHVNRRGEVVSKVAGKLSYSNVTATLALFVALSAGAYAAVSLDKDSVRSRHIKNGQVKDRATLQGKVVEDRSHEARLTVRAKRFVSGSPFIDKLPGYVRTEVYCDDNRHTGSSQ